MKVFADSMFTFLCEKGKKILSLICATMVEGIPKLEMPSFVIFFVSHFQENGQILSASHTDSTTVDEQ